MRLGRAVAMFGIAGACATRPGPVAESSGGSAAAGASVGSAAAPRAPAGAPVVEVTLADVGLEASSLDRSADPCVDFYQFACGGWLHDAAIPPDRARWDRSTELADARAAAIERVLEDAAKGFDASTKQLGDYYASCMDELTIEQRGLAAIKPLLARTQRVGDASSWLAAVGELHRIGAWVVWRSHVAADLGGSGTNVTYLEAAGLGLPDRAYYARPALKDKLDAYRRHVARLLAATGLAPARAEVAASDVVAIETELAKLTRPLTEQRDRAATYHPTDAAGLAAQVKSVDWNAYWKALGVAPRARVVVGAPGLFGALDRLRARFKPSQWASYFSYHLVAAMAFALPKAIDRAALELEIVLSGVEAPRARSARCVDATDRALGELVGQRSGAQLVSGAARQAVTTMIDAIVDAMGDRIGRLDWMGEPARGAARAKLAKLARWIGAPDPGRRYDYEVRRDDFAGNVLRSAAFETRRELARAGTPVGRGEWPAHADQAAVSYDPATHSLVVPAGILRPPYFGHDRTVAANLGGIGTLIGHELTHGFDDQGAQLDGDGKLAAWWQPADAARFAERRRCVAEAYATFEALPEAFVDGDLTVAENLADLGGVRLAFEAYRALRRGRTKTYVADGFTEDQQFFVAAGQVWCGRDRTVELQRRLIGDDHAPPRFRVYGALRGLSGFVEAFGCAPGTPMGPAATCAVW